MRYIILGSNGFIGKGLAKFLKKKRKNLIEYKKIPKYQSKLIKNNDVIINCLGKNIDIKTDINLMHFIKFLKSNRHKILWIQLSTPLVYNQKTKLKKIKENTKEIPFNKYSSSKLEFDNFLKKQKSLSFSYLILRVSTVYDKNMKSKVFKKLKMVHKSFLNSVILNPKVIINYISLKELIYYIYKLSLNKKSWNKIILISQNIKLMKLLGIIIEKRSFLNKLFFKFKEFLILIFSEQVLFLINEKKIENSLLKKFSKIEDKVVSNQKIIKFINL
tara:strand:- start:794 stop:1615 length:822 start_codon:yes stop_codon:yes gene_type:complete